MRIRYVGYEKNGRPLQGDVEAASVAGAIYALKQQGVTVVEATGLTKSGRSSLAQASWGALNLEWKLRTVRQLATFLTAGVPLDRALGLIESQSKSDAARKVIRQVLEEVRAGRSLSLALKSATEAFKPDEIALISAGEQVSSVDKVLHELGTMLARRLGLRRKVTSALIYPAFLLLLAPVVLIIITTVLVPNLAPLFDNASVEIPLALKLMMAVSTVVQEDGLLVLGGGALLTGLIATVFANGSLRRNLGDRIATAPMLRSILQMTDASNMCGTLSSLIKGGASLQVAIACVAEVPKLRQNKTALLEARDAVSNGQTLSVALTRVPALGSAAIEMITVGEETNNLVTMLDYIAEDELSKSERYMERLTTLLSPLLTVVLGLMIGGIVMSIMQAILSVSDMASR